MREKENDKSKPSLFRCKCTRGTPSGLSILSRSRNQWF